MPRRLSRTRLILVSEYKSADYNLYNSKNTIFSEFFFLSMRYIRNNGMKKKKNDASCIPNCRRNYKCFCSKTKILKRFLLGPCVSPFVGLRRQISFSSSLSVVHFRLVCLAESSSVPGSRV